MLANVFDSKLKTHQSRQLCWRQRLPLKNKSMLGLNVRIREEQRNLGRVFKGRDDWAQGYTKLNLMSKGNTNSKTIVVTVKQMQVKTLDSCWWKHSGSLTLDNASMHLAPASQDIQVLHKHQCSSPSLSASTDWMAPSSTISEAQSS